MQDILHVHIEVFPILRLVTANLITFSLRIVVFVAISASNNVTWDAPFCTTAIVAGEVWRGIQCHSLSKLIRRLDATVLRQQ